MKDFFVAKSVDSGGEYGKETPGGSNYADG
jgi:hypothetical protein